MLFKVSHMRNYKMQMRMGIHSGSCVGGVVGSKVRSARIIISISSAAIFKFYFIENTQLFHNYKSCMYISNNRLYPLKNNNKMSLNKL